ncbi:hypothetical protein COV18_04975 [Candidatus Woesearchaeota archaeon CG10_big_fil_rev_8_21_14_0_10_37_12]|nr:MAG: hypothetical protein COV18_04975 [Candidatus Woesearchaeota archaeon CG10_big_fil_rev_8_21_14_0_10_37_12]
MVVLVDGSGTPVELEQFRARIVIPIEKEQEIRKYLTEEDKRFHGLIDDGMIQNERRNEFYDAAVKFLAFGAYADNLLNPKYELTQETKRKLNHFRDCYLDLRYGWRMGADAVYCLEKLMRLGIIDGLSNAEKSLVEYLNGELGKGIEKVVRQESSRECKDNERWSLYVKLLSRYESLGLELDIPPPKKSGAETWLYNNKNCLLHYGLASVAPRAGLELPPLPASQVELEIHREIEKGEGYDKQLRLRVATQRVTPEIASIETYISTMHHLHLLLDEK